MATTDSGWSEVEPRRCDNAADFVIRRLFEADEPRSPSEMADAYGCGSNWMRQEMSRLAKAGEIERVSRGQYVDARTEPDDSDLSVTTQTNGADEREGTEKQTGEDDGSEDGDMPTNDEYQRQLTAAHDGDEGSTDTEGSTVEGVETNEDAPVGVGLPADPVTLGMVLGTAIVLWALYRSVSGDGSTEATVDGGDDQDDDLPDGGLLE